MQGLVDKVLVINMAKDTEKLAGMTADLHSHGIGFERVEGVDGRLIDRSGMRWLTPGMIGCFLSHRKCWQMVADGGYGKAVILEDDVRMNDGALDKLRMAMAEVPPDCDVLFLGCHSCGNNGVLDVVLATLLGGNNSERQVSKHLLRPGMTAGTYAYMITSTSARRLLAMFPTPTNHVDLAIGARSDRLVLLAVDPPMVTHLFDGSTIAAKAPVLLNALTNGSPFGDRRPFNWCMSEPLCRVGHDDAVINGWSAILFMAGGLAAYHGVSRHVVLILVFDYLLLAGPGITTWAYVVPLVALCLGGVAVKTCAYT